MKKLLATTLALVAFGVFLTVFGYDYPRTPCPLSDFVYRQGFQSHPGDIRDWVKLARFTAIYAPLWIAAIGVYRMGRKG